MPKTSKTTQKSKTTRTSTKSTKTTKSLKTSNLTTWGKIWRITLCIAAPLGGGIIISLLTGNAMMKFGSFNQPPLAPPALLFPIAWTILYTLMGLASYFVCVKGRQSKKSSDKSIARAILILYSIQLVFNFAWTPIFFLLDQFWFAFVWLLIMWVIILVMMIKTYKFSKPAFWMFLPYILWCTFAAYLNCGIAILN